MGNGCGRLVHNRCPPEPPEIMRHSHGGRCGVCSKVLKQSQYENTQEIKRFLHIISPQSTYAFSSKHPRVLLKAPTRSLQSTHVFSPKHPHVLPKTRMAFSPKHTRLGTRHLPPVATHTAKACVLVRTSRRLIALRFTTCMSWITAVGESSGVRARQPSRSVHGSPGCKGTRATCVQN